MIDFIVIFVSIWLGLLAAFAAGWSYACRNRSI